MKYLQIKYRNTCDLSGSLFAQRQFWYVMFINADVGKPTVEVIEEGREDGEKNFISDLRKQVKKYEFTTAVPEYQFDALCMVQMYDTIHIKNQQDEENEVFNFSVTLDGWLKYGDMAEITVSFSVRYDLRTGCCNNEKVVYIPCMSCNTKISVSDWVNGPLADLPDGISDRLWYMVGIPDLITGELNYNKLCRWRNETGWIAYEGRIYELVCFTHNGIYYRFWYDGNYWQPGQVIRTIVNSGTNIIVRGWCFPNTWVRLYISTNGINYTPMGAITQSGTFESSGISVPGLIPGTLYYFKFYMYNNNCNYGYSNVRTITKT